jgi:hypothetical protein
MYRPTHDAQLLSQMLLDDRRAHADADRLAALARGRRTHRPTLAARIGGQLGAISAAIRHQPATSRPAPATRA